jgi:Reverse transcriptase (RNA-dependent DNA polymerase)
LNYGPLTLAMHAFTSEKVYIIAGPEFGERKGHILIISRALYGLQSSSTRWHDRFADCIREIGFFPCKAEPDIWMRKKGNLYEYIAVYVDDLAIAMKDPKELTDILEKQHKFKLKGTGPISFHLGMDFTRDDDKTADILSKHWGYTQIKDRLKSLLFWKGDTADIKMVQEE